jgi:CRISPR-associated exonuclease Cas4
MTLALAALALALVLGAISIALQWRAGVPGRIVESDGPVARPARVLRSAKYGIAGKPDYLILEHGKVAPVEVKPTRQSDRPWLRDVVQLAAYCLLVDETHLHFAGYGYLRYANRTFKIDFTETMRAELLRTAERLRADLSADDVDPDHDDPRRCARCPVRVPCRRPVTG